MEIIHSSNGAKMDTLHIQSTKAIVYFFRERSNHQATLQLLVLRQEVQIVQDACIYHTNNQMNRYLCIWVCLYESMYVVNTLTHLFRNRRYDKFNLNRTYIMCACVCVWAWAWACMYACLYWEWCSFYTKGWNRCRPSPLTRGGPSGTTSHWFLRLKHLARYSPCWAAT